MGDRLVGQVSIDVPAVMMVRVIVRCPGDISDADLMLCDTELTRKVKVAATDRLVELAAVLEGSACQVTALSLVVLEEGDEAKPVVELLQKALDDYLKMRAQ